MGKGLFHRVRDELDAREKSPGLEITDLLVFPEWQCGLLNWMIRQGQVALADVTAFLGQDEACVRTLLAELCDKGYVREIEMHGTVQYRVRLAPKRGRTLPSNLWAALDGKVEHGEERQK